MVTRSRFIIAFLTCFLLLSASCKEHSDTVKTIDLTSLLGIVANKPNLSTLWGMIGAADMREMLAGDGSKTLLAPTNDAFAALGQDTLDNLLKPENKQQVVDILRNHIADRGTNAPDLADGKLGANQAGRTLEAGKDDTGAATIGGARVIESIAGSNGFIHIIDEVLLP